MKKTGSFYVYQLSDSRYKTVFYVGKGMGGRIDAHEKDAQRGLHSRKCDLIREIIKSNNAIVKQKIAWFDDEQEAYDFETEVIKSIGLDNLTNVLPGGQRAWLDRQAASELRNKKRAKKIFQENIEWLRKWLDVVDTWVNGVTIPGIRHGDKLARELVTEIRVLVSSNSPENKLAA